MNAISGCILHISFLAKWKGEKSKESMAMQRGKSWERQGGKMCAGRKKGLREKNWGLAVGCERREAAWGRDARVVVAVMAWKEEEEEEEV